MRPAAASSDSPQRVEGVAGEQVPPDLTLPFQSPAGPKRRRLTALTATPAEAAPLRPQTLQTEPAATLQTEPAADPQSDLMDFLDTVLPVLPVLEGKGDSCAAPQAGVCL